MFCIVQLFKTLQFISEIEIQRLKIQPENDIEELTVNLDDVTVHVPLEALAAARNGKINEEFEKYIFFVFIEDIELKRALVASQKVMKFN